MATPPELVHGHSDAPTSGPSAAATATSTADHSSTASPPTLTGFDSGASALLSAVGELARFVTDEFDVGDMLAQLCSAAAAALDVDGAGVMRADEGRTVFVRASDHTFEPVERLQETLQAGPCRDAVDTGRPVMSSTAQEFTDRWPAFSGAVQSGGIATVLALPLISRGRCWGTLDLYWRTPHAHTDHELAAAQLLADLAVSYVVMAADRAEARTAQEQLANRVLHDQLTGLPNRGLIHELIYHALTAAERRGTSVALLFIDLDKFKVINDTYGHRAGDLVLQEVARRLRATVRAADCVGRLSGDEFPVLCEDLPASAQSIQAATADLAGRISAAMTQPIAVADAWVRVTASVGIAITADRASVADLIHDADTAMYEAKASGPGATVTHIGDTERQFPGRRGQERELFEALQRQEFTVHYQPIVDRTGAIAAVEALLRWQHPHRGLLPAERFIASAESTGAVVPIGHWVIRQALSALARWRDTYPERAPRMVFCNLSPTELIVRNLHEVIADALTQCGLAPAHLGVEIVENNLADPRLLHAARLLQRAGHPLAIDDFGTGYSSLARLVDMPVHYLKIDRGLVAGLPADHRARTIVRAVLTIADDLDIEVISEGIETQAQSNYLKTAGSHLFQGYLHGRPMTADRITDLLASTHRIPDRRRAPDSGEVGAVAVERASYDGQTAPHAR